MMADSSAPYPYDVIPAPCELGLGLFAARDFADGELLFVFEGPVIEAAAVNSLGEREPNPLQIAPRLYVDVQQPGVYINHSCEPNAGVRNDVEVYSLRRILAGEEIRFDYSTSMSEKRWTMRCLCGTPSCRGLVTDFHELPEALRERYMSLGIVQRFIVEEIERATHR